MDGRPHRTEKITCFRIHNAAKHIPEALPSIIECLLQEGCTFVPISQIILSGDYTIDRTGRQCPA